MITPQPLQRSEILLGADYTARRPTILQQLTAHRAQRRVGLSDAVLLFESRQTVIGHIQEIALVEGRSSARALDEEIAQYGVLVPQGSRLTGTLMVHGGPPVAGERLARGLEAGDRVLELGVDGLWTAARLVAPSLPGTPVHYVGFDLPEASFLALPTSERVALRLRLGARTVEQRLPPALSTSLGPAAPALTLTGW